MNLWNLIKGADGIRRCFFDIDVAEPDDPRVLKRWDHCDVCPHCVGGWLCSACGCPLKCSLRVPEKPCPIEEFAEFTLEAHKSDQPQSSR